MGNMRFKVGDRVKIKSLDWYNKNKDKDGNIVFSSKVPQFSWNVNVRTMFTKDMVKFCGKVVTIESVWTVNYSIVEGTYRYYFTDEMIEGLVEDLLDNEMQEHQRICDEIIDIQGIEPIEAEMEQVIHCPDGYIFKDENGNVINATKIVLKKKKEYPITIEECCKILGLEFNPFYTGVKRQVNYKDGLLHNLKCLLIYRDAYWKIAGEEMGLGKSWEPDWNNISDKYCIYFVSGDVWSEECQTRQCPFAFPTPEMRNAFYENFKKEIKICKELL